MNEEQHPIESEHETHGGRYKKIMMGGVITLGAVVLIAGTLFFSKDKSFPEENSVAVQNYYQEVYNMEEFDSTMEKLWDNLNKETLEGLDEIVDIINEQVYDDFSFQFENEVYKLIVDTENHGVNIYTKQGEEEQDLQLISVIEINTEVEENPFDHKDIIDSPIIEFISQQIRLPKNQKEFNTVSYKGDKVVTYMEKGDPYIHEYRLNPINGILHIKKFK